MGATLEVIQKKRAEKPEVRDAAREAALRYVIVPSLYFSNFLDNIACHQISRKAKCRHLYVYNEY